MMGVWDQNKVQSNLETKILWRKKKSSFQLKLLIEGLIRLWK